MLTRRLLNYEKGVDSSPGCYVTNYTLAFFVFAFVIYFWKVDRFSFRDMQKLTIYTTPLTLSQTLSSYFLFAGVAFTVAGLVHQEYPHNEDHPNTPEEFSVLWRIVIVFTAIANVYLWDMGDALRQMGQAEHDNPTKSEYFLFNFLDILIILAMSAWAMVDVSSTFAAVGLMTGIAYIYQVSIALYSLTIKYRRSRVAIAIFGIINIMSLVIQVVFGGPCGKEDPDDCPLPEDFNHNALFHVVHTIGLVGLGMTVVYMAPKDFERKEQIKRELTQTITIQDDTNIGGEIQQTMVFD